MTTLALVDLRRTVRDAAGRCRHDTFAVLRSSNSDNLSDYLLTAALKPILDARKSSDTLGELLPQVWTVAPATILSWLDDVALDSHRLTLRQVIECAGADARAGRLVEQLFVSLDVVATVEELWQTTEWLLAQLKYELSVWHEQDLLQSLQVTIPSENLSRPATSRGALQLQTSSSTPVITAGNEFSIFVIVRNPFDVPVTVYTVETQIPVELLDVVWEQRRTAELASSRSTEEFAGSSFRDTVRAAYRNFMAKLKVGSEVQPRIAQAITATEGTAQERMAFTTSVQVGEVGSRSTVAGIMIDEYQPIRIANLTPAHVDSVLWRLTQFKRGIVPVVLQPGDSVVKQFIFRTRSWLLFTPVAHSLRIELRYSIDNRDHIAAVAFDLTIQAALTATMIGATLGGVVGATARELSATSSRSIGATIGSIVLAATLSAIAIVSFARKNAAQQLLSVEDFWGGLLLGFLVGFLGQQFALSLIKPGS